MIKNWSFAKITDILLKKIEVSDCISKSLSQQNFRFPSPYKAVYRTAPATPDLLEINFWEF